MSMPFNNADDKPGFLTFEQVIRLLNIKPDLLHTWMRQRKIRFHKFGWKIVRFSVEDLEVFIERALVPDTGFTPAPLRRRRRTQSIAAESKDRGVAKEEVAA